MPIVIEKNAAISQRVQFITHGDPGTEKLLEKKYYHRKTGKIIIKNNTWIGAGVIILSGITIGQCCIIGAGSVVTKDIKDYSVAVGNPAKIIKKLK